MGIYQKGIMGVKVMGMLFMVFDQNQDFRRLRNIPEPSRFLAVR
jgi:hypothetical protein